MIEAALDHDEASSAHSHSPRRRTLTLCVDKYLALAAAPTFAGMAILTAAEGHSLPGLLCSAAMGTSHAGQMWVMYALMSLFHSTHWIRRFSVASARS
jgi:hypothetical protein